MTFDRNIPTALKETQKWFGSIISRPMDEHNKINSTTPTGRQIEEEAKEYIAPSPTLQPAQRIQIYNQQYWWRLLTTLHEVLPLVTRLFGHYEFNQVIAIPYLVKYPPNHWSLNELPERLTKWVEEEYLSEDKQLILNAVSIDQAYNNSFIAMQHPVLDPTTDASILLDKTLKLQPYVYLFEMPYDLFAFRGEFLQQEPEYWLEHDFPPMKHQEKDKQFCFVLFRNVHNQICVETISPAEYEILKQFEQGTSIEAICEWLEGLPQESALYIEASRNLHLWFQRWAAFRLFYRI